MERLPKTLQSFDVLAGGEGQDMLFATINGTGTYSPTLSGIEALSIETTGVAGTLSLVNSTGVTSIESTGSTVDLVVSNINSTATALKLSIGGSSPTFSYTTAAV